MNWLLSVLILITEQGYGKDFVFMILLDFSSFLSSQ